MCAAICPGEGEKFYPHSSTEEGLSPGARKEKKSFLYTWTYMGGKPRYHVSALKIPLYCCGGGKGKEGGEGRRGKKTSSTHFYPFWGFFPFLSGENQLWSRLRPSSDWLAGVGWFHTLSHSLSCADGRKKTATKAILYQTFPYFWRKLSRAKDTLLRHFCAIIS